MATPHIELHLADGKMTPICFPINSFFFSLNPEGGSNIHTGTSTFHVDQSYEYIVAVISSLTYIARTDEDAADAEMIDYLPDQDDLHYIISKQSLIRS